LSVTGIVLLLALLAGIGLLLVPVSLRLFVAWDDSREPPWSLGLHLGGIALLSLPARPRARSSKPSPKPARPGPLVPPWLRRWTRRLWRFYKARRRAKLKKTGAPKSRSSVGKTLMRFVHGAIVLPTRRFQVDLGGVDPATLGMMQGVFLSIDPLMPRSEVLRFRPVWGHERLRGRVLWHLRSSVLGLLWGILVRRRARPPALLPSSS